VVDQVSAEPELYGAGLFSTGAWDYFMAWSPDQRDVFFDHANDDFSSFEILETRLDRSNHWSAAVHPGFAKRWSNSDPHTTIDGRRVFFISNRPLPGDTGQATRESYDVWYADRDARGNWGDAQHLIAGFNDPTGNEWSPAVAANGNMYFGSNKLQGGRGDQDLWVSRFSSGAYDAPENLGDSINTRGGEIEPWIAPDESYLIFSAGRRADSVGKYDLYIATRRDGVWQKARALAQPINTPWWEFNPSVSPDGKWLYFSSNRPHSAAIGDRFDWPRDDTNVAGIGDGKKGDIYRVRMAAVWSSLR
jgi:Tol biopolymer transport system component